MLSLNLLLNVISTQLIAVYLLMVLSRVNAQNETSVTTGMNTTDWDYNSTVSEPTTIVTMGEFTTAESEPTIIEMLSEFTTAPTEPTIIQTINDFTTVPSEPTIIQTMSEILTVESEPTIIQTLSEFSTAPSEPTILPTINDYTTAQSEPTIIEPISEFSTVPSEPTIIDIFSELTTAQSEPTIIQTINDFTTAESEPTIIPTMSELSTVESEPTIIQTMSEFATVPNEPTILPTMNEYTTAQNEPTIVQTLGDFTTAPQEPTIIQTISEFSTAPSEPTIIPTMNEFTTPPDEPTIIEPMSEFTTPPSEPTIIPTITELNTVESEPTIIQTLADLSTPFSEPTIIQTLSDLTTPEPEPTIIVTERELSTPQNEPTIRIIKDLTTALSEPTIQSIDEFTTALPEPTIFQITDFTTGPFRRRTTATPTTETPTTTPTQTPTPPPTPTKVTTNVTDSTIAPTYDCTKVNNCGIYGKCNNYTKHCDCANSMFTVDESNRCAKNKMWCKSNCGDENNCVIINFENNYKLVCDCSDQQKYVLNKTTGDCDLRSHCGRQEDGRLECDKHKAMCLMDQTKPNGYYCQCPKGMHNISNTCIDLCEIPENIQKCYADYGFCVNDETDLTNALHCECYAGFYRISNSGAQAKCEMALFTVQLSVIIRYLFEQRFKSVYYASSSVSSGFSFIEQQLNQDIQTEADKNLIVSNSVKMIKSRLVDGEIVDVALVNCRPSADKSYDTYNCVLTLQLSKSLNESYIERKITEKCVNATITGDNSYYCALDGSTYLKKLQTVTDFEPCTQSLNLCQKLSNYSVCAQEIGSTQYQCLCPKGFRAIKPRTTSLGTSINRNDLKLEQCEDIDECAEKLNCSGVHQSCANTIGSYECHCDDAYIPFDISDDNSGCVSVCAGVDCGPHGNCVPKNKSEFHCECNDGFSGDKCLIISNKEPKLSVEWIVIISAVSGVIIICLIISGFVFRDWRSKKKQELVSEVEQYRRTARTLGIELNGQMRRTNAIEVTSL